MSRGPVLIDLDDEAHPETGPAAAPAVPDLEADHPRAAMQTVAAVAARRRSGWAGWFWTVTLSLLTFIAGLAAWDYVTSLLARSPLLATIAATLIGAFVLTLAALAIRELAAFARLKRLDSLQKRAAVALAGQDMTAARDVLKSLEKLYANRPDTAWGRAELTAQAGGILDADAMLALAETQLLAPLDARAQREVEAAARQVATVTAVVPLALADLFAALTSNLRMIRRIAEIYGGRSGALGSWRLTRSVLTHLVATGAVAVGDDLIGSVAGGGVLTKVSRRFGEGVINGALTARVGVAAIEVCRPLPFTALKRPSVTTLVRRSLTGVFGTKR